MGLSEWDGTAWAGTTAAPIRVRDAEPAPRTMVGFPSDGGLMWGGVTASTSLGLSATWRAIDILTNSVSQLPWVEMRGNLPLPPSRIVQRPSAWYTRRDWTSLVVATLALFDVCYLLPVGGPDNEGVPLGLWPLDPTIITPTQVDYFSLTPPQSFLIAGQREVDRSELVILHRSVQPTIPENVRGVLTIAQTAFAAAIAADRYASRFWQAGGLPTTVLQTDASLDDGEATSIQDRWMERRSRGPDYAPVLSGGVKAENFGADPTAASAVEARREMVADVGRYFGIPTDLLNAPTGDPETYRSSEAHGLHLVKFTVQNYIDAIEDAITDLLPGGRRLFIDPALLYHGTQYSRAQTWQLALAGQPWMDVDEVREYEGLPPREITPPPAPIAAPPVKGGSLNAG